MSKKKIRQPNNMYGVPVNMIGIELERNGKKGHDYCMELLDEGLVVKDTHDWVIRFSPPIICTKDDIDFAVGCFEKTLR